MALPIDLFLLPDFSAIEFTALPSADFTLAFQTTPAGLMNKSELFLVVTSGWLTLVAAFALLHSISLTSGRASVQLSDISVAQSAGDSLTAGQQQTIPPPPPPPRPLPPPPFPNDPKLTSPSSEPVRQLSGSSEIELQQLASYLPKGSAIATFPVGETQTRAAKSVAVLDKTGRVLTVLVYSVGGRSELLELGVFAAEDGKLAKLASTKLPGSYVYTNIYDRFTAPFGIVDVNGDGLPEIIVTSSQGASLGAQLQVFSFDGATLNQIAEVTGHQIQMISTGAGRTAIFKSKWKEEDKEHTFAWKSGKLEEVR
ncbi:MAG: hypothetical protein HYR56_05710 [Acidobacteria bacterium]|nr:hypothetical protein [Acidobacteriota bacterium]MBI3423492.1 hypothetical protein [Acidobacteriota bacterium]